MTEDRPNFRQSKHIYLGTTRIATKIKIEDDNSTGYERLNTYYYHSDHLGSAQMITDYEGLVYEHMEYSPWTHGRARRIASDQPYGELWVEEQSDSFEKIPFRFTGKELDKENNLYYYGARYLNPQTSRWMSADPLGSELANPMNGRFSFHEGVNWYGYCRNNPIRFTDPTGMEAGDTIGPGDWNPPGHQKPYLYMGRSVHEAIASYYRAFHITDKVYTNYTSANAIASDQDISSGVGNGLKRPDIYNYTLGGQTYEIKIINRPHEAATDLAKELVALKAAGLPAKPGDSYDSATYDIVEAPGGYAVFFPPAPGIILYQYKRGSTVEEPAFAYKPKTKAFKSHLA